MKKRAKKIALVVVGVIATTTVVACNQYKGSTPEELAEWMMEKVVDKLELNEQQTAKLVLLKDELLVVKREMGTTRDVAKRTLDEMLQQPTLDQAAANRLVKLHTETVSDRAPEVIAALAGFYDELNLEQQAYIRDKMDRHLEHRGHFGRH
ncbi:hypothetical protein BOW53_12640 [Solemya pervernicosa gill symbiont]|uniref:Zinc resistance-associated protein n=2 Tax=Gammaproteobacteria incertae sedis TaxID=118884 RepID=A0A1T2L2D0_9GAMM|nr:Spy/CpxP family protein refolding chaperone [Candidatus Reidiella endopervernicosa]OOZ39224.1 hypothetical protein BOW53_12640 [Solemya pervernicosa gill symbiont]QKQ28073.1 Spy/CpxP family protein refolding chaperone [Candidatus Reidiella endopervernicosa]